MLTPVAVALVPCDRAVLTSLPHRLLSVLWGDVTWELDSAALTPRETAKDTAG